MTYRVNRLALLEYALDGARTCRGIYSGALDEEIAAALDADIAELERRVERAKQTTQQGDAPPGAAPQ
jgi:hypothetical protein